MKVTLGQGLSKQLRDFATLLRSWDKEGQKKLHTAFRRAGVLWKGQAVRRVPVDEGYLKQRILNNTFREGALFTTEVGSNVPYAVPLEFGTKFIAGGKVLAIGDKPEVTDTEAVHTWAAKEGDATKRTSHSIRTDDSQLLNRRAEEVRGPQEQMPWLRSAFVAVKPTIKNDIDAAYVPPKGKL